MSFILRQFQEGDRFFSAQGVGNTGGIDCWVDDVGNYKDSFLIVEINGKAYPILTSNVISIGLGYFFFTLPSASGLISAKIDTTLKLKSKCSTDESDVKTALTIDFNLSVPSNVFVCNEQINLIPNFKDRVRLFFGTTTPNNSNIVELKLNDSPFNRINTFLEQGYSNTADSNSSGLWKEVLHSGNSVYWSTLLYTPNNELYIKPATLNYFTVRLGYLELIFDGVKVTLINYLNAIQTDLGTYTLADEFIITSTSNEYSVVKGNITLQRIGKTLNFSVSGGTLSTNVATAGAIITWNLPNTSGNYDFNTYFNEVFLTTTINLQNCIEQTCELRHKLDGFMIKCCSEGQAEIYRNHIRVGVIDLNILGEGVYKTKIDGFYQLKVNCNGIWGELSPYQYFSFYDNCKPKTCGINDVTPTSATYLTNETAKNTYIAKTGTSDLSGSLVPNTLNTVNFGSNSFPINKVFASQTIVDEIVAKNNTGISFLDISGINTLFKIKENGDVVANGSLIGNNISGINTGDNAVNSLYNGLITSKLDVSTASSTYAPIASPTFTGIVSGITKTMVGLGNVDNTSDINKPISTATQTALDLKLTSSVATSTYLPINNPTAIGTATLPTIENTLGARFSTTSGNVIIGNTSDNGSKFQVTGGATFSASIQVGNSTFVDPPLSNINIKLGSGGSFGSGIQFDGDAINKGCSIINTFGSLNVSATKVFINGEGLVLSSRTAASAEITPSQGQINYISTTNATFTSTGFWGYTGTVWVKL